MNCQDALRHSLAGAPFPADAQEHVRTCPTCALELSELRSIESRLFGAAPPALPPMNLERQVLARLRPRRRFAWAGIPAAAALLVGWTLMTAWLLSPSAPDPSLLAPPLQQVSNGPVVLSAADDSTATLLQAYDPLTAQMMDMEPEEIQEVLSPTEQGGWNG
jgi:hypothetical protein